MLAITNNIIILFLSCSPERIKCEDCGNSILKTEMEAHKLQHTPVDQQLQCPECTYATRYIRYLEKHMKLRHSRTEIEEEKKIWKCELCTFSSCFSYELIAHKVEKHPPPPLQQCTPQQSSTGSETQRPYICMQCSEGFQEFGNKSVTYCPHPRPSAISSSMSPADNVRVKDEVITDTLSPEYLPLHTGLLLPITQPSFPNTVLDPDLNIDLSVTDTLEGEIFQDVVATPNRLQTTPSQVDQSEAKETTPPTQVVSQNAIESSQEEPSDSESEKQKFCDSDLSLIASALKEGNVVLHFM